jgi:hypothetical protein
MAIAPLKSFAEVQQFLTEVSTQNGIPNSSAPHGAFWNTTYQQFTTGNVPGVTPGSVPTPVPILVVGKSAESNIILALRGQGPLFDPNTGSLGQMPAEGNLFSDEQINALAAWIDAGCPE